MPLKEGSDRETISHNIREMIAAGHPRQQAVAAALRSAGQHARKKHHSRGGAGDAPIRLMTPQPLEPIPYSPVSSSWIQGLRWTPERGAVMRVRKTGKAYDYPGISRAKVREWLSRVSKGKWWWGNVGHPMKNSRWTGPVHPLFANNAADGPINFGSFSPGASRLMAWMKSAISPHTTPEHLAALTGWMPGTEMNFWFHKPDPHHNIPSSVESVVASPDGNYNAHRAIHAGNGIGGNQRPYVENELFTIPKGNHPYRGASGPVLLRQIRAAYELGIPGINFFAAYEPPGTNSTANNVLAQLYPHMAATLAQGGRQAAQEDMTGGLHWPLMGADGIMPPRHVKTVPQHILDEVHQTSRGRFAQTSKFSDFFTSPQARDWYVDNPTSHDAFIDTTPGSYSRKAIERHVAEKSLAHGLPIPIPDQMMPKKPLHLARQHYAPHIQYLIQTGSLHPEHFDAYFDK